MAKPHKNIIYWLFSLLYGLITGFRNLLFNWRILPSRSFPLPVISVGNLAVGGTGKTPHTELLIRELSDDWKTAVLSRGYKRKTKGFHVARLNDTADTIGDEPYQMYIKFPHIIMAVDEKRVHGIREILDMKQGVELILLDDAYQHRYVKPGLSILLTDYHNLYSNDWLLPFGTLRENARNSRRADIIIVTKCDKIPEKEEKELIREKLKIRNHQQLFFSSFKYGDIYPAEKHVSPKQPVNGVTRLFLLTGIEKPQDMQRYLSAKSSDIVGFFFPDHHDFTAQDISWLENSVESHKGDKMIVTTEKDYARLKSKQLPDIIRDHLFILPVEVKIAYNEQEIFINKIKDYVSKNSGNG